MKSAEAIHDDNMSYLALPRPPTLTGGLKQSKVGHMVWPLSKWDKGGPSHLTYLHQGAASVPAVHKPFQTGVHDNTMFLTMVTANPHNPFALWKKLQA